MSDGELGSLQRACRRRNNLIHTVVVKQNRHSTRGEEYGYALAHDHGVWAIYFKSLASMQFHREDLKRLSLRKGS